MSFCARTMSVAASYRRTLAPKAGPRRGSGSPMWDLLDTLRRRELEATAARIAASAGLPYHPAREGEPVAGVFRQRLELASGRFALIDDGLGFSLVPWSPSLERHLGRQVMGIARASKIEWSFGRARGPTVG